MKNHWLNIQSVSRHVSLCAKISCSQDEVPGACLWDLYNCKTLDDCLREAIRRSEELTVIGPADKIVLMTISSKELFSIPGMEKEKEAEDRATIYSWVKKNEEWVPQ